MEVLDLIISMLLVGLDYGDTNRAYISVLLDFALSLFLLCRAELCRILNRC